MSGERIEDRLVFRAGAGEWYNQPHNKRWDMGEDVADIPSADWHVALEEALAAADPRTSSIVIDVAEMDWLVGQDIGFLLALSGRLAESGNRPVVVCSKRVLHAIRTLGLGEQLDLRLNPAEPPGGGSR